MGRHSGVWLRQQNIWKERNLENVENEEANRQLHRDGSFWSDFTVFMLNTDH